MKTKNRKIPKKQKRNRIYRRGIGCFIGVLLLIVSGYFLWHTFYTSTIPPQEVIDKLTLEASPYKDIDTKFLDYQDKNRSLKIEYPITKYEKINAQVAAAIDNDRKGFDELTKQTSSQDARVTFNSSYQVPYTHDDALAIVVTAIQDIHGAHDEEIVHAWTFNTESQKPVTIQDIAGSKNNVKHILAAVKTVTAEELQKRDVPNAKDFLNDVMSEKDIENFVITDKNTMTFHFGRGRIAPQSAGVVATNIDVKSVKKFLQNDTARHYFDVPKEAPKPKPKKSEKPATSTPAPRGSGDCPNCVAITYDDGPGVHTNRLLDTLDNYGVKASFIVIGQNVQRYPDIVKREVQSGMTIVNHSWNHPDFTTINRAEQKKELVKTNQAVKKAAGVTPHYVRFPYGTYNNDTIDVLKELGMSGALWDVDTRDWADRNSSLVCNRAVSNAHGGAIILMHDIHPTSVDAAPCVIEGLQKRGLKLVTLDRLLRGSQPGGVYFAGQ